ncbi:MAG TPA: LamG domain-containing protein [Polyangia bacterium]|nr:LamG domain-containing protein [Polyangia bacterium]
MRVGRQLLLPAMACCLASGAIACTPGPLEIASLPTASLANGLVGHWRLDEDVGDVANDSSGNGRTGFAAGPGWSWVPGQFGSAMHFSGVDYVTVGGLPRATPSYSVSAWVLIQANELGAPVGNILSTEALGGGWALFTSIGMGGQQSYVFRYATNAVNGFVSTSCMACVVPGVWTHLTAVVDADAAPPTLTLYVNGVTMTALTGGATILPGSTVLDIARSAELSPTFPITGALDDVTIYARALVEEEVAELSLEPAPNPQ